MKPLGARPLGRFARPRRRLRAGLLRLLCAVAGLVLGLLLPGITVASTVASTRVLDALMAVGFGVLGLVSIIFSLLFLVVQWAFGSLSRCGELASARISGLRGREDVELGGLQLVQDRPERTQAVLGRPGHAGRPCGEAGPRQAEQNNECPGIVPTGLEELRLSSALLSCMTGKVCLCKSVRAAQLLCRSGPH